jgi:hypothetical protein
MLKCHYVECHYAESRGATTILPIDFSFSSLSQKTSIDSDRRNSSTIKNKNNLGRKKIIIHSWGRHYIKLFTVVIGQHVLDTNAGKQLSQAATDV